jgi:methylated-DNA-protein-cysteine methyltransferase related protein
VDDRFSRVALVHLERMDRFVKKARRKSKAGSGNAILKIERAIRAIPRGKVSTYGGVARAAGLSGAARMVARVLRRGYGLPWQRVLGAGGQIKLTGDSAMEQRFRLEAEGVRFRGRKVDMQAHEWKAGQLKTSGSRSKK